MKTSLITTNVLFQRIYKLLNVPSHVISQMYTLMHFYLFQNPGLFCNCHFWYGKCISFYTGNLHWVKVLLSPMLHSYVEVCGSGTLNRSCWIYLSCLVVGIGILNGLVLSTWEICWYIRSYFTTYFWMAWSRWNIRLLSLVSLSVILSISCVIGNMSTS